MSKQSHIHLPSFEDIENSFGFQLATVREPRMTQEQLADAVNNISSAEVVELRKVAERTKKGLETNIAGIDKKITELQSVEEVTGDMVAHWEDGVAFPTVVQFKNIKLALSAIKELDQPELDALNHAYTECVKHANIGNNTPSFGAELKKLVRTRRKIDSSLSEDTFAEYVKMAGDPNELQNLQGEKEKLQKELEILPEIKAKNYFIADGKGERRPIVDASGNLQLTGADLRRIEHGAIPSRDLYEVIIEAMNKVRVLNAKERDPLDEQYKDLIRIAMSRFSEFKDRGILDHDPFEGGSLAPVHEEKLKEEPTNARPHHESNGHARHEGNGQLVESAPPITPEPVKAEPPVEKTVEPKPQEARFETATTGVPAAVTQLAETYAAIFAQFGMEAPSDTKQSTSRQDNSAGVRAELGEKIRVSNSVPELRPFSLTPLSDDTMRALISKAPNVSEMQAITKRYNALVAQIKEDILHSESGVLLNEAQQEFEKHLSRQHKGYHFEDIKFLSSTTDVAQKNFDDYFRQGGLQMPDAKDIEPVLKAVNNAWLDKTSSNILKHDSTTWRSEVSHYINAHRAVRQEYNSQRHGFEVAMHEMLDKVRHNAAMAEIAREFALLDEKIEFYRLNPDPDFKPEQHEFRKHEELGRRVAEEPEFADAVRKAKDTHSHMDAHSKRKATSTNGAVGVATGH